MVLGWRYFLDVVGDVFSFIFLRRWFGIYCGRVGRRFGGFRLSYLRLRRSSC